MKCLDEGFIDFLQHCFIWEPDKRITPAEALKHKWITQGQETLPSNISETNIEITQLGTKQINTQVQSQYGTQRDDKELNKTVGFANGAFRGKNEKRKTEDKLIKFKEVLKVAKVHIKEADEKNKKKTNKT